MNSIRGSFLALFGWQGYWERVRSAAFPLAPNPPCSHVATSKKHFAYGALDHGASMQSRAERQRHCPGRDNGPRLYAWSL